MARTKSLNPNLPVPQDDAGARDAVRELGERQRELTRIEAAMNDEIAEVKARHDTAAGPLKARIAALSAGIQVFAEANRERLTEHGRRKHHRFATGEISWRVRPPRVTVRGIDAVLARLREGGLTRFIRVKEEVNRDAMLAEPEAVRDVPGITIGSAGEDFIVEPDMSKLGEAA